MVIYTERREKKMFGGRMEGETLCSRMDVPTTHDCLRARLLTSLPLLKELRSQ